MLPQTKNLQIIQALRGIASLLVVLFHCTGSSKEYLQQSFLGNAFLFGWAGVDVFFVLSGFIITYTNIKLIQKASNLPAFLQRRFVRIYPTYWIIISFFLLLQILFPSYYRTHYNLDFANIASTYLLFPGHVMINGVSWTLSYELFFYMLFGIAFFIRNTKLSLYLAITYAVILILLPIAGYNFQNSDPVIYLITYPMNVEFIMGVVAAVLIPKLSSKVALPLIISGCIIFIISAVFSDLKYYVVGNTFNRVILFGTPSFLLIIGVVKYELLNKIKVNNIVLLLGEASYSLYLIHLPLLVASFKIISNIQIRNSVLLHFLIVVIIVIICYASILFYKFVEKPLISRLNMLRRIKVANEI